jgi:protein gp37
MGDKTAIQWTDATANFWRGCDKVSPGCAHCYMFTEQRRYGRDPSIVTLASPATFGAPLSRKWRARAEEIAASEGRRMRVFTCSWSDFFHEKADLWCDAAWDVIRRCPEYDWQILTKRPELIASRLPGDWGDGWPHVWLGVSIENRRFVHRADVLRDTPAAVRFISAEPLLGPLIAPHHLAVPPVDEEGDEDPEGWEVVPVWDGEQPGGPDELDLTGIDWLIVGGESGPGHRPMREEWVRDLRNDCQHSRHLYDPNAGQRGPGTAFFVKQDSGLRSGCQGGLSDDLWAMKQMPAARAGVPA